MFDGPKNEREHKWVVQGLQGRLVTILVAVALASLLVGMACEMFNK